MCIYKDIHIYINTHKHTHSHTYTHAHTYPYFARPCKLRATVFKQLHTIYIFIHTCVYIYIYIYTNTQIPLHIPVNICTYIHIYIHTHAHTHMHTRTHTYIYCLSLQIAPDGNRGAAYYPVATVFCTHFYGKRKRKGERKKGRIRWIDSEGVCAPERSSNVFHLPFIKHK